MIDTNPITTKGPNQPLCFNAIPISPEELETGFVEFVKNAGVDRRIAFTFLGKSSEYYYQYLTDEAAAEAFLNTVDRLSDYIKFVERHRNTVRTAQARIIAVLEHNFVQAK